MLCDNYKNRILCHDESDAEEEGGFDEEVRKPEITMTMQHGYFLRETMKPFNIPTLIEESA